MSKTESIANNKHAKLLHDDNKALYSGSPLKFLYLRCWTKPQPNIWHWKFNLLLVLACGTAEIKKIIKDSDSNKKQQLNYRWSDTNKRLKRWLTHFWAPFILCSTSMSMKQVKRRTNKPSTHKRSNHWKRRARGIEITGPQTKGDTVGSAGWQTVPYNLCSPKMLV